ncbi:MAG: hypothetical protein Q8O16_00315 [Dehalococcoidia bacterium]|nr:hypothetical protein [Dehalococcoidia bacterium]
MLLSSWADPRCDDQVYKMMDEGINYIQKIHKEVLREKAKPGSAETAVIATQVAKNLGLPQIALNPLFFKSIKAHLNGIVIASEAKQSVKSGGTDCFVVPMRRDSSQ